MYPIGVPAGMRSRALATASVVAALPSMPILTASTPMSSCRPPSPGALTVASLAAASLLTLLALAAMVRAFAVNDLSGKPVNLADYKGKTVVLEWNNPECPFVRKQYGAGNMQAQQAKATAGGVVEGEVVLVGGEGGGSALHLPKRSGVMPLHPLERPLVVVAAQRDQQVAPDQGCERRHVEAPIRSSRAEMPSASRCA